MNQSLQAHSIVGALQMSSPNKFLDDRKKMDIFMVGDMSPEKAMPFFHIHVFEKYLKYTNIFSFFRSFYFFKNWHRLQLV